MKKEYVKLVKLIENICDDESDESIKRWKNNVIRSGVENGYCLDCRSDDVIIESFESSDLDCVLEDVYDFMGSVNEDERFYFKNVLVYEYKDGSKWIENRDNLFEF